MLLLRPWTWWSVLLSSTVALTGDSSQQYNSYCLITYYPPNFFEACIIISLNVFAIIKLSLIKAISLATLHFQLVILYCLCQTSASSTDALNSSPFCFRKVLTRRMLPTLMVSVGWSSHDCIRYVTSSLYVCDMFI